MKEKGVPLTPPKVVRFLTGRRNSFKKKASLNFRGIRIGIRPCPSGRDWVAPGHRRCHEAWEGRAAITPKTFACFCLEAHAAQPASRGKPNHYSQETRGRDVLEANV